MMPQYLTGATTPDGQVYVIVTAAIRRYCNLLQYITIHAKDCLADKTLKADISDVSLAKQTHPNCKHKLGGDA
jgi:hypothetical protein